MDQASVTHEQGEATPIFTAYRRGYDPEQVDRYVADQQRRLDETTQRASEAERKLAAAVGQLRELHRRVAVLESEDRSPQPAPLDTLGERVQRILQEAWEGAYALRQSTEQEMAELRERTSGEAEAIIVAARQRARAIEAEIERRRNAYLEQVEQDRSRAIAQITHLHNQRDGALGELLKVKAIIEATVADVSRKRHDDVSLPIETSDEGSIDTEPPVPYDEVITPDDEVARFTTRRGEAGGARDRDDSLAATMQVHRLEGTSTPTSVTNPSDLVRNHRASSTESRTPPATNALGPLDSAQPAAAVFDFEEEADR
jgi:cell division septum initiation protein DivIVA